MSARNPNMGTITHVRRGPNLFKRGFGPDSDKVDLKTLKAVLNGEQVNKSD